MLVSIEQAEEAVIERLRVRLANLHEIDQLEPKLIANTGATTR